MNTETLQDSVLGLTGSHPADSETGYMELQKMQQSLGNEVIMIVLFSPLVSAYRGFCFISLPDRCCDSLRS